MGNSPAVQLTQSLQKLPHDFARVVRSQLAFFSQFLLKGLAGRLADETGLFGSRPAVVGRR